MGLKLIIAKDANGVGKKTALEIINLLKVKKDAVLGLATGGTAEAVYPHLIKAYEKKEIDFKNVKSVNLDEYKGLDPKNEQSYRYFMNKNLFDHVNIDKKNTFVPSGIGEKEKILDDFNKKIEKLPRDIQLLGVGPNGHIAFNEPGSSLSSRTRIKTLRYDTIKSNARFFDGDISQVPQTALTVGIGTIMDADEVMIIATGRNKAEAIKHGIEGSISHMWPISILQMHQHGIIVCDEEAVSMLEADTIKYFKEIENHAS